MANANEAINNTRSQLKYHINSANTGNARTAVSGNRFTVSWDMVLNASGVGVIGTGTITGRVEPNLTVNSQRVIVGSINVIVENFNYRKTFNGSSWGGGAANIKFSVFGQEVLNKSYDPHQASASQAINRTITQSVNLPINASNQVSLRNFARMDDTWLEAPTSTDLSVGFSVTNPEVTRVEEIANIYIQFVDADDTSKNVRSNEVIPNRPHNSTYTYNLPNIPGYDRVSASPQTITVKTWDEYVIVYYRKRPTTGKLTLEYRSRKDNRKLASDRVVDVLLNTDYVDTARDIPQYTPENKDIRVRVTGNQTYTVWYNPVPWNVKIEYRLRDGNRLITDKTVQVPLDGTYTETAGDRDFGFHGKVYPENPNVSIRPTGNMTYVVYYKQYPFLTTKYLERGTNKEIKTQGYKQLTIKSGNYTETAPDIAKYRLVGSRTNNVSINTNSTGYTTTFYYELVPTKADVTVRYLDRATGKPLLQERVLKDQTIGQEITQPARPVTNYDVEQGTLRHTVVEGTNIITFYYNQVAKIRPWAIRKSGAWKSLNTQKQFMKIRRTANQNYWDTKSNAEIFPSEVNKDNFSASRIRKSGVWKSQGRIGQ